MFWSKKKKAGQTKKPANNGLASYGDVGTSKGKKPAEKINGGQRSSADIRAEALANARAARERVGEETIQKIAKALVQQQMSLTDQAKAKIARANSELVADEIRYLLDGDDNQTRH
jgi:hypothetical protein